MPQHPVIITLPIEAKRGIGILQSWRIYALEKAIVKRLRTMLPEAEHDGHELPVGGPGEATIFIFGPSASRIADIAAPLVRRYWRNGPATLTTFENETFEHGVTRRL